MKNTILSLLSFFSACALGAEKPNIIIIYTDDQGYGDLSCYGATHVSTPRIDKMAEEGVRLTSFYMAAAVCTPSRAAIMTGSYPVRTGVTGVMLADDPRGLNPDEITIAEMLKTKGYQTALFGKWHLGHHEAFLPPNQGFDEFFGIPYSHDIHPYHPRQEHYNFPPLPLINQNEVIETDPDADYLTKRFTEKTVDFIERNKEEPFFIFLSHPIPHVPLHASPEFTKSVDPEVLKTLAKEDGYIDYDTRKAALFGPCIDEIDWSVGEVLDALEKNGLTENTIVIFTTDNGPAVGSAGPLRGKKGSLNEGGSRVPGIIKWPAGLKAGQVNDEVISAMDLFPTFAHIVGAEVPQDRIIDGKNVLPVLQEGAKSPHEAIFYHRGKHLAAVRSGDWKLFVIKYDGPKRIEHYTLYNLKEDINEKVDVKDQHPEVVERLKSYVKAFKEDIAANQREIGMMEE